MQADGTGCADLLRLLRPQPPARYNVTAEASPATRARSRISRAPRSRPLVLVIVLAIAAGTDAIGQNIWFGQWQIARGTAHPIVLLFALSGSLMISKTLRIPKP